MPTPPFLFDLDGTLADTLGDIAASVAFVRGRHGLPPLPLAAVRGMVGDGALLLLQRALGELRRPPHDAAFWQAARALYGEHHRAQCTATVQLYPGVGDGLQRFAAAGHPLAVVTNKPRPFADAILRHLGIDRLLPVVVGGDCLPQRKPDPAPLRLALERLGCAAAGASMVGDGTTDLRAGRAAGLATIGCLYGYRSEDELRAVGADRWWRRFGGED